MTVTHEGRTIEFERTNDAIDFHGAIVHEIVTGTDETGQEYIGIGVIFHGELNQVIDIEKD